MTDQIVLKGISARGFHGVLDFEKRDGQTFVVDVTMHVDLAAGRGQRRPRPTRSTTPRWPATSWPSSRATRST